MARYTVSILLLNRFSLKIGQTAAILSLKPVEFSVARAKTKARRSARQGIEQKSTAQSADQVP
jgi:hypothetical protein